MDEASAWKNFVQTGSIIDYLRYADIKENEQHKPEDTDAFKDSGDYNKGFTGWRN